MCCGLWRPHYAYFQELLCLLDVIFYAMYRSVGIPQVDQALGSHASLFPRGIISPLMILQFLCYLSSGER